MKHIEPSVPGKRYYETVDRLGGTSDAPTAEAGAGSPAAVRWGSMNGIFVGTEGLAGPAHGV